MTSPTTSPGPHVHASVYQQDRYDARRRILRDYLLRPIGFGLLVKVHIEGEEHIPAAGPTIIAMNHIGSLDPFVVAGSVRPRFVVPMSKAENYHNPIVGLMARSWGAYPVRRGEVDRQALESTILLLEQGRPVLIAPEGTRQPALSEPKDGMTYVAVKTGALIVPTGVEGSKQFPGAYLRLRRPQIYVKFGRAFRFKTGGRTRIPRDELRQMTREAMYQIAVLLPEYRRGAYRDLSQMTTEYLEFID
jgi:1-acyl-sn-glycerol-3-phosphate acyltransferase